VLKRRNPEAAPTQALRADTKKPGTGPGFGILVAKGGIEPPTRGSSVRE